MIGVAEEAEPYMFGQIGGRQLVLRAESSSPICRRTRSACLVPTVRISLHSAGRGADRATSTVPPV